MPIPNFQKHNELPIQNGIDYKSDEIKFIDICDNDEQIETNDNSKEKLNHSALTNGTNNPHIHNIEIFLSQAAKISVTDGIINMNKSAIKSKNSTQFLSKNGGSNIAEHKSNDDLNEDGDEFPKGIRIKNWFSEKCSSNSSLNGSISSATSSASKLTVFMTFYYTVIIYFWLRKNPFIQL